MPEETIKRQGGALRWRTVELPGGKYMHCAITRKTGKRGGHTVCGPVRKVKLKV